MSLLARSSPKPIGRLLSRASSNINNVRQNQKRGIQSIGFTCWFRQPDIGMTEYEYLSRGSASLLSVDPPAAGGEGPYGHLAAGEEKRKVQNFKEKYGYSPATGDGAVSDMGWLQFMPKEHRPNVHVVTSSHVVAPFLWLDYYPHDWLTQVRSEHCKYTLEVFDSEKPGEVLGSYELHNTPIHHPEGRDIAFIHLQDEETALKEMKQLGVKLLHLRDPETLYSKGETIYFDGFLVHDAEPGADLTKEDTRIFEPYEEIGTLDSHTDDRFFAQTSTPLPEGLCGAPALDKDGALAGVVEGIVPIDHENQKMAGQAAFMPAYIVAAFQDYTERFMLQKMMPKDVFQDVVKSKETNSIGGGSAKLDGSEGGDWNAMYEQQVEDLKKKYSKEEVDAILWNIKRERKEVMDIMNNEGGDMDEVIQRVRAKTIQTRERVIQAYKRGEFEGVDEPVGEMEDAEDDDVIPVDDLKGEANSREGTSRQ